MRRISKWRNQLAMRIATTDLHSPCKETIVSYANALCDARQAAAALDEAASLQSEHSLDLAVALSRLGEEMRRQNDLANAIDGVVGREAWRALADVMSGQIVGHRKWPPPEPGPAVGNA